MLYRYTYMIFRFVHYPFSNFPIKKHMAFAAELMVNVLIDLLDAIFDAVS